MADNERAELRSLRPPIHVSRDAVYFAFGDGTLEYDCQTCNAQCCRGHGFLLHHNEFDKTLQLKPAVAWFSELPTSQNAEIVQIRNCPPACFFLDRNGRCDVQVQYGFDAKPETCRLFPFNEFRVLGDQLIVSPHRTLCPLSLVRSGGSSVLSEHNRLWEAMTASGINSRIRHVSPDGSTAADRLAVERAILAASRNLPPISSYEDFVLIQTSLKARLSARQGENNVDAEALEKFGFHLRKALGTWPSPKYESDGELLRLMIAMTPTIRSWLLFLTEPSGELFGQTRSDRVPFLILALHKVAALALEAGMERVTFQTISRLFQTYLPTLTLLSFADCRLMIDFSRPIDLSTGWGKPMHDRYVDIVRALMGTSRLPPTLTVGEIVNKFASGDPTGRLAMLNAIANRVVNRLSLVSDGKHSHKRASARAWFQKTLVSTLNNDQLFRVVSAREKKNNRGPAVRP